MGSQSRTRLSDWTELKWILTKTTSHHSSPLISYLTTPLHSSGVWTGLPAFVPALSDLVSKEKPSHSYYNIQIMVQLAPNLPMLRLIPSHNNDNRPTNFGPISTLTISSFSITLLQPNDSSCSLMKHLSGTSILGSCICCSLCQECSSLRYLHGLV